MSGEISCAKVLACSKIGAGAVAVLPAWALAPASFGSLVGSRPKCEEGEMMEDTIGGYVPSYRPRMALTLKAVRH